MNNKYYFTSESVTEGHPDKLCDYISDTILDEFLKQDPNSRVAVETFAFNNNITIAGQVTSTGRIKLSEIVREKIKEIGFDNANTDMDYRTLIITKKLVSNVPNGIINYSRRIKHFLHFFPYFIVAFYILFKLSVLHQRLPRIPFHFPLA